MLNPYLFYQDTCEAAFNYYAKVLGGRIDATAGLYYFRQSLQSALRLAFGAKAANFLGNTAVPPPSLVAFNGVTSSTEADLNSQSVAVFAQGTWHFHPRLALTIGARGTYERKSGVIDRPANAAQSSYHQALAVEEVDPSGTLALTYARSRDLHLYASYARGAKAGGINPIVATATDDQIVRPEHADSFELGLKSSALGARWAGMSISTLPSSLRGLVPIRRRSTACSGRSWRMSGAFRRAAWRWRRGGGPHRGSKWP